MGTRMRESRPSLLCYDLRNPHALSGGTWETIMWLKGRRWRSVRGLMSRLRSYSKLSSGGVA